MSNISRFESGKKLSLERFRKDSYVPLTEYKGMHKKIILMCPNGHNYETTPSNFKQNKRCVECRGTVNNQGKFLKKAKEVHGDKYDYSKTVYIKALAKITIICPEHGEFNTTTASSHLTGVGCNECGKMGRWDTRGRVNEEDVVKRVKEVHGDTYDYSDMQFKNTTTKINIICKKHGGFKQLLHDHLRLGDPQGCPQCAISSKVSKGETEITDFITSLGVEVDTSNRKLIAPLELDIVCHEQKIAIEFNGLYWHNELAGKGKYYHKNKTDKVAAQGYRLVHIFEDDWSNNKDRLKSFIRHLLGKDKSKAIYGRKCDIEVITRKEAKPFFEKNHIQGLGGGIYVALIYEDEIVACTSFQKGKSNTKNKDKYELVRHATSCKVIGALGKTTKFFATLWTDNIYTFCDLAMFNGVSYTKAGFTKVDEIAPDYKYHIKGNREHKFNWRLENIYSKYPECEGMTETAAMRKLGFGRIWDCGKARYEYQAH